MHNFILHKTSLERRNRIDGKVKKLYKKRLMGNCKEILPYCGRFMIVFSEIIGRAVFKTSEYPVKMRSITITCLKCNF
jgi:hypothetical protein